MLSRPLIRRWLVAAAGSLAIATLWVVGVGFAHNDTRMGPGVASTAARTGHFLAEAVGDLLDFRIAAQILDAKNQGRDWGYRGGAALDL